MTEYKIEYLNHPRAMVGLPYYLHWNVYKVNDGILYHIEGFKTKKEAKNYIDELEVR